MKNIELIIMLIQLILDILELINALIETWKLNE